VRKPHSSFFQTSLWTWTRWSKTQGISGFDFWIWIKRLSKANQGHLKIKRSVSHTKLLYILIDTAHNL